MNLRYLPLCGAALALVLCACNKPAPEATTTPDNTAATTTTPSQAPAPWLPAAPPPDAVLPVEVKADAIAVGSALGPNQAVTAAKPGYSTSDTIYVSMPTQGRPAGANAHVYWTAAQTGMSVKEEDKKLSGDYLNFQLSKADGMKPGNYNVQIDVNDKPVGIVDFKVQ